MCFFPTSLCGVLVLLAAIPPDSVLPSLLRPSLLRPSLTHAIILSSDLFPSHTIISSSSSHLFLSFLSLSFIPHISVWGSSFVGCHPARLRPSLPPSLPPPRPSGHLTVTHFSYTHTHTLILSSHLFLSHLHLIYSPFWSSRPTHPSGHLTLTHTQSSSRPHPLTTSSIRPSCHMSHPQWPAQSPETAEGAAARVVAAGGPALSAVAGAVSRDCRRGCGARCRRWGPGSLHSGRRSLQRLQKGLRRALSPLGARLSPQWPAQSPETAEGAAAGVVAAGGPDLSAVAGAVSGDCRRGCGARCRRSGPGSLRSGRRSLQRLQTGLRRALSPLGARLSPQWPAQSPETAEGAAARVAAAGGPALSAVAGAVSRDCRRGCGARCRRWGRGSLRSGRRSLERHRRGCGALSPLGARLSPQWPARSPETAEGAAARVVAAGGPCESHCKCCGEDVREACLCATGIVICKAMVLTVCESHCTCCGEGVREACLCAPAIVFCKAMVLAVC